MRRVPVNLATVPYERARHVRRALLGAMVVVALLSVLHAGAAVQLVVGEMASQDPAPAGAERSFAAMVGDWQEESAALAAAADPARTRQLAEAVELANGLISWHALPWEPLFAALEEALPEDVRLELVRPSSEADGVSVELVAASRSRSPLGSLLVALEGQPALSRVVPTREDRGDDGRYRMTIRATYRGRADHGADLP